MVERTGLLEELGLEPPCSVHGDERGAEANGDIVPIGLVYALVESLGRTFARTSGQ